MAKAEKIPGIDCDAPVDLGIRLVLITRLEEFCSFRTQALDWSGAEGVHDMRVASRRLRGALKDFSPYLGKNRLSTCEDQIKTIAQALGRVRDYDVEIMTLEKIATTAPSNLSFGIRRFAEFRQAARAEEREKLLLPLSLESIEELRTKFAAAFQEGLSQRKKEPKQKPSMATMPYREAAQAIILNRLENLGRFSESLYHPLKVKPLHKMRIAAKHLRYALELFGDCWGSPVVSMAKKLADLQSSLGKLHDCDVWIENLGHAATHPVPVVDFDYRATAVWLLGHFLKLRGEHVSKALAEWNDWKTEEVSAQLRRQILTKPSSTRVTMQPGS
jgi:CHAD domain-containing protein